MRVEDPDDIQPQYALPMDGRDFYLTEFFDFKSPDGFYRKYRLAVVDGVVFPRHMIISDSWLIHAANQELMVQNPELASEEAEWLDSFNEVTRPSLEPAIAALSRLVQLEYFGIDCHLNQNGEMILFEVNPNMNILISSRPAPDPTAAYTEDILRALENLMVSVAERGK